MNNLHLAVTNTHKDIVTVYSGGGKTLKGLDISGNEIAINATLVATEQSRLDGIESIQTIIENLESLETPRRLAESVLSDEGKAWLTTNREKIVTERAKL